MQQLLHRRSIAGIGTAICEHYLPGCIENKVAAELKKILTFAWFSHLPACPHFGEVGSQNPGGEEHAGFATAETEGVIGLTLRIPDKYQRLGMIGKDFAQIGWLAGRHHNQFATLLTESVQVLFHLAEVSLAEDSHQVAIEDQDQGARRELR